MKLSDLPANPLYVIIGDMPCGYWDYRGPDLWNAVDAYVANVTCASTWDTWKPNHWCALRVLDLERVVEHSDMEWRDVCRWEGKKE